MSVFSNKQIRQGVSSNRIVCLPYNEAYIGQTSLDLTLGYYYYRVETAGERTIYNPLDREDVERHFDGPYKAMPHEQWCQLNGIRPLAGIPLNHPVIGIKPGEHILAHTHEFFGVTPPSACEIKGQPVWEHNGIGIRPGSWISPASIRRQPLEISNLNSRETILLPVGERIVQAVFYETGNGDSSDDTAQPSADLDALMRTWSPGLLLPEAWRGTRTLPVKIEGLSYD